MLLLTKLDAYDYEILTDSIRIELSSTNDPNLVDIMSEIHRSKGRIYVEGRYFMYLDEYKVDADERGVFIELKVKQL